MGADLIGWRSCALQRELGPDGFLGKLKLRSYRAMIEQQVPPAQRAGVKVTVQVTGRPPRILGYPEIVAESDDFRAGIPECADCPLSSGRPLGCYQYVTYPVDAQAEELIFAFFTSQVTTRDSICDQLYRDVVSRVPASGTGWHDNRGAPGTLAMRPEPLRHKWGGLFSKKTVDSAQVLRSLFLPLDSVPLIVAYARFWTEFLDFARARGVTAKTSSTIGELFAVGGLVLSVVAVAPDGGHLVADA